LRRIAAKVAKTLQPGAEFQFTFDLGDFWAHRCTVGQELVDPLQVRGVRPDVPLPYWAWVAIPDQYGRRWAGDNGESRTPTRPRQPHPMLAHDWPGREQVPALDVSELREAVAAEKCGSVPRRGEWMRHR
jgi:hypothetical protein